MKKFGDGQQPFHAIIDIPEGDSQELTTVTDQALNSLYGELFNLLQTHGINPTTTTSADLKQVARAVWSAVSAGNLFVDTGTANVKSLTHIRDGDFLYRSGNSNDNGFVIEFLNKVENTGAVVVNVFDIENNQNHFNNTPLLDSKLNEYNAKALPANCMIKAYYDASINKFVTVNIYNANISDSMVFNLEQQPLQKVAVQAVEAVADLEQLQKINGRAIYVKSYYAGLNKGGGVFVYDSSKAAVNDGGLVLGGWVRQVADKISPFMFGAKCDGVYDDSTSLIAADNAAYANKINLVLTAKLKVTKRVSIKSFVDDCKTQVFNADNLVSIDSGQNLRPEWWGADPTNTNDSYAAFMACFANAQGRTIELSGGYKFLNGLTINYEDANGLQIIGKGASLIKAGNTSIAKTFLNFDSIPEGQTGLKIIGVRGLVLQDFHVSHCVGKDIANVSVWLMQLDMFRVTGVTFENKNGVNSTALKMGYSDGNSSAFMGVIENCEFHMNGGYATWGDVTTSLNHINCYNQGGKFYLYYCNYCTYLNCSSEGSPSYGFIAHACANVGYTDCGTEANTQGGFLCKGGCSEIEYRSPFAMLNFGTDGHLICIDATEGANGGILISSPTSSGAAGVNSDILSISSNEFVTVTNVRKTGIPKGIKGDSGWRLNYLKTTGGVAYDNRFNATPVGFVVNGTPTTQGTFIRNDNIVEFVIKITPATDLKTTADSVVQMLGFYDSAEISTADMFDANNKYYGKAIVDKTNAIKLPAMGSAITVPLFIKGSIISALH